MDELEETVEISMTVEKQNAMLYIQTKLKKGKGRSII